MFSVGSRPNDRRCTNRASPSARSSEQGGVPSDWRCLTGRGRSQRGRVMVRTQVGVSHSDGLWAQAHTRRRRSGRESGHRGPKLCPVQPRLHRSRSETMDDPSKPWDPLGVRVALAAGGAQRGGGMGPRAASPRESRHNHVHNNTVLNPGVSARNACAVEPNLHRKLRRAEPPRTTVEAQGSPRTSRRLGSRRHGQQSVWGGWSFRGPVGRQHKLVNTDGLSAASVIKNSCPVQPCPSPSTPHHRRPRDAPEHPRTNASGTRKRNPGISSRWPRFGDRTDRVGCGWGKKIARLSAFIHCFYVI